MKVLMIGPYPPPYGGIAVVVKNLMDSDLKNKISLMLLATVPMKTGSKTENFSRIFTDIFNLLKYFIYFRPDIVHIHTSYDLGWLKHISYAIISKIFGYRVVLHIHAYHLDCRDRFPEIWLKRLIFPPIFVFGIVDCIFTLSDKFTENIKKFSKKSDVMTIPNGINLKIYSSSLYKDKNRDYIVISFIGTIEKRKGIFELMAIAKDLIEKIPNIKIIIAGDGPERYTLDKWQNTFKYKNVVYLGKISEEKKIKILKDSDIFVLQSANEGIPIAILEAMTMGCAIITTSVGSIPDIIKNDINGILIPPKDKNALLNAVMRLCTNDRLLIQIRENNLKEKSKYSLDMISGNIFEAYKEVINR